MSQNQFREKIKQLQQELSKCEKTLDSEGGISMMTICAAVIPVLLFIVFYFLQPSFVQEKESGKPVRSLKKIFIWTAALTIVVWIGMYIFTQTSMYQGGAAPKA